MGTYSRIGIGDDQRRSVAASNFQEYIPSNIRGVMTGVFLVVMNLTALVGIGTLVAMFSDYVFPQRDGLRFSLAYVVAPTALSASILYLIAGRQQRSA